jgi:hypothetical protein
MRRLGLIVEPDGQCQRVDLVTHNASSIFGTRHCDGLSKANYTPLSHDPAEHEARQRPCIECWVTCFSLVPQTDNPTARIMVQQTRCFSRYAAEQCRGRVLFIGWGGASLSEDEVATLLGLAGK